MKNRTLLFILLLALGLRLWLLAYAWNNPGGVATPDTQGYVQLSDNLLRGEFELRGQPEVFRTPGYPLFLLIGTLVDSENWWHLVLVVQVLADVLLVYLTYLLGCLLWDRRAGLLAAAFQATSAIAAAAGMRVLSDGLFAMLLALAVLLFVHHWKLGRMWSLLASAVVLGAACYVRPVGQVFAAVLAAALAARMVYSWRHGGDVLREETDLKSAPRPEATATFGNNKEVDVPSAAKRSAVALLLFVVVGVGVIAPWVVRNGLRADYWGFSSFASDSMYFFAVPEVIVRQPGEFGLPKDTSPKDARAYVAGLDDRDEQERPLRSPGEAIRQRQAFTHKVISEHPWLYAKLHLRGVVGFFLPGATDVLEIAGLKKGNRGTSDVLHTQGLWAAVRHYFGDNQAQGGQYAAIALTSAIVAVMAAQYLGVLLFLVRRFRPSMPAVMWVMLAMVVVAPLLSGPYGFPRYQTMIVPLLSVLAAVGYAGVKRGA